MLREYLNVILWWFSTTVGEGRLWERLRIYSGKLFIAIKIYENNVTHVKTGYKLVSVNYFLILSYGKVYSKQHYIIKFVLYLHK